MPFEILSADKVHRLIKREINLSCILAGQDAKNSLVPQLTAGFDHAETVFTPLEDLLDDYERYANNPQRGPAIKNKFKRIFRATVAELINLKPLAQQIKTGYQREKSL